MLAVCGGYQLLGRHYLDRYGSELPGAGLLPLHTVAGERRMIGDVLLECELDPGERRTLAGFENHAGRTILDTGAEPLGRVISGFGNDGTSGFEGCRAGRVVGTYLHGPLLPRNPWFADWLLAQAARAPIRRRPACVRAARRRARRRGPRGLGRRAGARAAKAERTSGRARERPPVPRRGGGSPAGRRRTAAATPSARTALRSVRSRGTVAAVDSLITPSSTHPSHRARGSICSRTPRIGASANAAPGAPSARRQLERRHDQQLGRAVHRLGHAHEILEVPVPVAGRYARKDASAASRGGRQTAA